MVSVYRARQIESSIAGFATEDRMNNRELNDLLREAKVPEPSQSYWENFPGDVTRIARSSPSGKTTSGRPTFFRRSAWWTSGLAFGAACIAAAFVIGYKAGHNSRPEQSLASIEKCLHEVESMFPNQVRAIIFEKDGARLLLSDAPDVPGAMPVYLKVCDGKGCQRIVTFSGQKVPIKGKLCDVLVDSEQNVLVVGQREFWPGGMPLNTRVEARTL
jgi:hypothetical protein